MTRKYTWENEHKLVGDFADYFNLTYIGSGTNHISISPIDGWENLPGEEISFSNISKKYQVYDDGSRVLYSKNEYTYYMTKTDDTDNGISGWALDTSKGVHGGWDSTSHAVVNLKTDIYYNVGEARVALGEASVALNEDGADLYWLSFSLLNGVPDASKFEFTAITEAGREFASKLEFVRTSNRVSLKDGESVERIPHDFTITIHYDGDYVGVFTIAGEAEPETIHGDSSDNTIIGNSGNDHIYGNEGHDTIFGRGGVDHVSGNIGNDQIHGGRGDDVIYGNGGDDTIRGGRGNDVIYGNGDNDQLHGDSGDDVIYGGKGNDYISDSSGNNRLYGGGGNDVIIGSQDNDYIEGNDGDDTLYGGRGNDKLYGGIGIDTLNGNAGVDELYGGEGNDILNGGADNDVLDGGDGIDKLYGGAGNDIFVLSLTDTDKDVVHDFDIDHDEIRIDVQTPNIKGLIDQAATNDKLLDALRTANINFVTDPENADNMMIYNTQGTAIESDDVITMVLLGFDNDDLAALSSDNFDVII